MAESDLVQELPRVVQRERTDPGGILGGAEVDRRSVVPVAVVTAARCVVAFPLQLVAEEVSLWIDECIRAS